MQQMIDYLMQHPKLAEQLIFQNPETKQAYDIAGGKVVHGYYSCPFRATRTAVALPHLRRPPLDQRRRTTATGHLVATNPIGTKHLAARTAMRTRGWTISAGQRTPCRHSFSGSVRV